MLEQILESHGDNVKYIIITKSTERKELEQLHIALAFIQNKIDKLTKKVQVDPDALGIRADANQTLRQREATRIARLQGRDISGV